jgi:membrane associated rhomboid family serine protease
VGIYDRDYYRDETAGAGWLTGQAPVTKLVVLTNVAVCILITVAHHVEGVAAIASLITIEPSQVTQHYQVWRLVTGAFCHDDLWHILWNLLMLWWFGRELEMLYGSREYLVFYLTAAVLSTLVWSVAGAGQALPPPGASGAMMAVMVVYTLYYPRERIHMYGIFPVEMRWFLLLYLGVDAYLVLRHGSFSVVRHTAQLAGAAYGLVFKLADLRLSRVVSTRRRPRLRVVAPEVEQMPEPVMPHGLSETLEHRMDEILAKISREGRASLNDEERQILDEASRRLRDRRS